jgi:hypothetical protein
MTSADQQLVDSIAAVLPEPSSRPMGYEDASELDVRRLYASEWVKAGFTDAIDVRQWVSAGVQNAAVARSARRAGYLPEDPWVERSAPASVVGDFQPTTVPGSVVSWRNRRRARRAWLVEQRERDAIAASVRADAADMAALVRAESFGSGLALSALQFLDGTGAPIEATDVLLAFDELMTLTAAMQNAGNATSADAKECRALVDVVMRHLDACTAPEQETMRGQLVAAAAWLDTVV